MPVRIRRDEGRIRELQKTVLSVWFVVVLVYFKPFSLEVQ